MIVPFTELPDDAGGHLRPLVDVVVAEMDDVLIPCLVDSGALNTLLPGWVATACGISLADAERRPLTVAATTTEASFVTVRLTAVSFSWEAPVAFCSPWPYGWGLVGQLSFFRFFTVTFRAADQEMEIVPIQH